MLSAFFPEKLFLFLFFQSGKIINFSFIKLTVFVQFFRRYQNLSNIFPYPLPDVKNLFIFRKTVAPKAKVMYN